MAKKPFQSIRWYRTPCTHLKRRAELESSCECGGATEGFSPAPCTESMSGSRSLKSHQAPRAAPPQPSERSSVDERSQLGGCGWGSDQDKVSLLPPKVA